jgi:hypothetical protein
VIPKISAKSQLTTPPGIASAAWRLTEGAIIGRDNVSWIAG